MLDGWTWRHAWRVRRHVRRLIRRTPLDPSDRRATEAARMRGWLPIYADIGGTIYLSLSGRFLVEDHATGETEPLSNRTWQDAARVKLARSYPDLEDLGPIRPAGAPDCPDCDGTGVIELGTARLGSGRCATKGWLAD